MDNQIIIIWSHNIIQLMSCVQLPWFQIQIEALEVQYLEALFSNLLHSLWTQLINLAMSCM